MKFKAVLSMLTLAAGNLVTASAQDEGSEEVITLSFSAIAWGGSIREPLYFVSDSEYVPLRMTTTSRSKLHEYIGPNPITFYAQSGPESFLPVAQTNIPEGLDRALLLFSKKKQNPGSTERYRIISMDDSIEEFPRDSYRFINWTPNRVVGKLSDQTFALNANSSTIIEPKAAANNQLSLQLVELKNETPGIIYSNIWPYHPNTRKLVILLPSNPEKMEKVTIIVISDYLPVK